MMPHSSLSRCGCKTGDVTITVSQKRLDRSLRCLVHNYNSKCVGRNEDGFLIFDSSQMFWLTKNVKHTKPIGTNKLLCHKVESILEPICPKSYYFITNGGVEVRKKAIFQTELTVRCHKSCSLTLDVMITHTHTLSSVNELYSINI